MHRNVTAVFLVMVAVQLAAAPRARSQFTNGSFEPASGTVSWMLVPGGSTAIPGWTTTDNGVEWFLGTSGGAPAPDGQHVVDIATYVWSAGGIAQTIATVPGEITTVTFSLGTHQAAGRDGTCEITVDADGQSQLFTHANPTGAAVYAVKAFAFLADDASATIRFRCVQNAYLHFAYLDAVGTEAAVASQGSSFGSVKALFR